MPDSGIEPLAAVLGEAANHYTNDAGSILCFHMLSFYYFHIIFLFLRTHSLSTMTFFLSGHAANLCNSLVYSHNISLISIQVYVISRAIACRMRRSREAHES